MSAVSARKAQRCVDVEPLLDASVDHELVGDDAASVHAHVLECASCRTKQEAKSRLKAALQAAGSQIELPRDVEERIVAGLHDARRRERSVTAGIIGVAAVVGVVAFGVMQLRDTTTAERTAAASVVDQTGTRSEPPVAVLAKQRHATDLPVDVASPDPQRVAEFLRRRIGHPVQVPPFQRAGWGLEGGRVIEVADRPAAQLVYRSGLGAKISVIAVPDPDGRFAAEQIGTATPGRVVVGDHAVVFSQDGALYSIVGDLGSETIESASYEFAR